MMREAEVFLFRHGETDWNVQGRFQGATDIPLNSNGIRQAEALRTFFAQHPPDLLLTSDLGRARETARIAMGEKLPTLVLPGIRETNLGAAEGMTRDQVIQTIGDHAWEKWYTLGHIELDFRFPGGESKRDHIRRIVGSLQGALDLQLAQWQGLAPPRIAVSTHGGVLRRFAHYLFPEITKPVMISNCVVYRAKYRRSAKWEFGLEPVFDPAALLKG
jgi:broad specificity phosphatase PhoE